MGDFVELLGSGRDHGCTLTYRVQDEAGGIAQALGLAELFCTDARCAVILGDNIFHDALGPMLADAGRSRTGPGWPSSASTTRRATAWPSCKATASSASRRNRSSPRATSPWPASTSTRRTSSSVIKTLKPSNRGELEITEVNSHYLEQGRLGYSMLQGYWTDAGTLESLATANMLVRESPPVY